MKSVIAYFCIFCFATAFHVSGQTKKSADLAVLSFVKKKEIILRWAPGTQEVFKTGNIFGYKVQRVSSADTLLLSQTPLKPWNKNDERWKILIKKNKNAALLFNFLFNTNSASNKNTSDMFFGMILKSCDLYPEIAKAGGLYFKDSTISDNERYVYRISLLETPKTFKYSPATIEVNAKEYSVLAKIKPIKAKFGNKRTVITLETITPGYSGFWIERSADSINFSQINKSPIVHATTKYDENKTESVYPDSLPVNNKIYYYRVRGISYFGDLSEPSAIVSGKGKDDFLEYPLIDSTTLIKNKAVQIKFRMPDKFDLTQLRGYFILRCEKKEGKYVSVNKNILPINSSVFMDEKPLDANYYKICAINLNDDSSFSYATYAKLIDETPPLSPEGLTGKIDSNGVVTIIWFANCEPDLLGYRVYRCNSEKEQPVELTTRILTDLKYTDKITLQTLTKEVYYTLRAVDKVYNNSDYAIKFKLIRPDKIPPVAPLFKQIVYTDTSIQLIWQMSTSNDVATYALQKNAISVNSEWKSIKQWKATDSLKTFSDTAISIGKKYQYRLEVYDDSKNYSFDISQQIFFQPAVAPKMKSLKAGINVEKRNIQLTWNNMKDVYNYTIYKAKGNDPLRILKTVDAQKESYIDSELYPNNTYRYTIKATLNSGIESKMADVIEVNF